MGMTLIKTMFNRDEDTKEYEIIKEPKLRTLPAISRDNVRQSSGLNISKLLTESAVEELREIEFEIKKNQLTLEALSLKKMFYLEIQKLANERLPAIKEAEDKLRTLNEISKNSKEKKG